MKIEKVYATGHHEFSIRLTEGIYIVNYTTGTFTRSVKLFIEAK